MAIQHRLLLEQIELLRDCELGQKFMGSSLPTTIEAFREQVPLTTYTDYCPDLLEKREDGLPRKPVAWVHSPGIGGEYPFKWIPFSERYWDETELILGTTVILATCKKKGEISLNNTCRLLHSASPLIYLPDISKNEVREELGFRFIPPVSESLELSFEERLLTGYKLALAEGVDCLYGVDWLLATIGDQFKRDIDMLKSFRWPSQTRAIIRLLKGSIKSKLAGRPMLPKDVWSVKGITSSGTDSTIYNHKIKDIWGVHPLEVYGDAESLIIATQTWDRNDMTFIPNLNFLEFISEEEHMKWQLDHSYQPETILLDEVKAGENYELVITNFHGGAMIRYRVGDIIKITSLRNENLGIDIPQMTFVRHADDLIDIGLMRLTEKIIWQALENTGIPYLDWTARQEIINEKPMLHLYLELKNNYIASEKGIATAVYEQIKKLDDGFIHKDLASLEGLIGFKPIAVTLLSERAFSSYSAQRKAEGTESGHLVPPHINPSDDVLSLLGAKVKTMPEEEIAVKANAVANQ